MQIFVQYPSGPASSYEVDETTSVDTLKAMIENNQFLPMAHMRLVNGAEDVEEGTLSGNGIEEEDTLTILADINGGMRKKWKKKRMRRLRRKRRKMRQRAR
mmetsp:Transcript_6411/g.7369  ORF Transcript_6411/g.7369 Transcript_6411/m.7369 type:complete len:101 (+) Transcript_6411:77-379(+)|eukprot:CAMPEP_0204613610 /NCGR_PEP_ID=MMETSP0717-20131115/1523_1 /ASSEMBLY_ACC=CAM_ASM_000666 /TAXON_ID=230516 /ORGANISM="Chaetoceros curvisetus" /LENGTH=100 /DNA_ID=CAMNT_0051626087 /DNA_START=214 /DNA_END=516 /DNA_ORIENTATION=-